MLTSFALASEEKRDMDFLKKPLFSVDGLTITVGLAIVAVALLYFFVLRKK